MQEVTGGSRAGLVLGALVLLLLVGYSTVLASGFWSPRAAVLLILGAAGMVALAGLAARPSPLRLPARLAAAFVAWAAVATVASGNRTLAFFGLYNQGTGLLFVAALAGGWALAASASPDTRLTVERAVLIGVLTNAAVALVQTAVDLSSLHLDTTDGRAAGLLGNPVHLGALAAAAVALVVPRVAADPGRWGVAVVVLVAAVQLSGTRSALVALVVVAAVTVPRHGRRVVGLVVLLAAAGFVLAAVLAHSSGTSTASARTGSGDTGGLSARTETWMEAGHGVAAHPLVGVGPGRFAAATSSRRSLAVARAEGADRIFTDGHDLVVEYATTTGVPGALLLLAWLGLAIAGARGPRLCFALAVLAVGLLEPQSVVTTPLALLVLGAAAPETISTAVGDRWQRARLAGAATAGLVAVAAVAGVVLLVGDFQLDQARLDFSPAVARRAEQLLPAWPEPATRLAKVYVFRGEVTRQEADRAEARRWREEAVRRDPADPALWNDVADAEAKAGDSAAAEAHYRKALTRDPWSVRALNGLGRIAAGRGDAAGARTFYLRSLRVLPDQPDVRAQVG